MKVLLLTIQEDPPSLDSYDSSDDNYSKTFKELIKNCLQKDPKKRPIASQLLAHKVSLVTKECEAPCEITFPRHYFNLTHSTILTCLTRFALV